MQQELHPVNNTQCHQREYLQVNSVPSYSETTFKRNCLLILRLLCFNFSVEGTRLIHQG